MTETVEQRCDTPTRSVDQECGESDQLPKSSHTVLSPPASPTLRVQSFDNAILRTLSSSPISSMSGPITTKTASNAGSDMNAGNVEIPRRNLQNAFEEIYVDKPGSAGNSKSTPDVKSEDKNSVVSPTGVADLMHPDTNHMTPTREETHRQHECLTDVPMFSLHEVLQRDLSQDIVNRVSFYGVIHDINKEASAMASNDDSDFNKAPDESQEKFDALVVSVNGEPQMLPSQPINFAKVAVIDEEKWLLSAIDLAKTNVVLSGQVCPPTFLQAMGEREYENPLTSLSNGSRTQLWKPSRSWWEAKSGKNPWIEPKSHNKRWRYLWPLIHYHKFLARCIKKLKRNGVDVKTSVSPVAAFLREDVCAVSDHLASVSLFDSDQWMSCLKNFDGWTPFDQEGIDTTRIIVSRLSLRSLQEPGDVASPLLRNQIDAQFLRTMAAARVQMTSGSTMQPDRQRKGKDYDRKSETGSKQHASSSSDTRSKGLPPMHPKNPHQATANMQQGRWPYGPQPGHVWYAHGWNQVPPPYTAYADDTSVHSGLSGDTNFSQMPYDMNGAMMHPQFYPPHMMYGQVHPQAPPPHAGQSIGSYDTMSHDPRLYHATPEHYSVDGSAGWMGVPQGSQQMWFANGGDPNANYAPVVANSPIHQQSQSPMRSHNAGAHEVHDGAPVAAPDAVHMTPAKSDANQMPPSPYWGHLNTLSGIVSPHGNGIPPQTPQRKTPQGEEQAPIKEGEQKDDTYGEMVHAQPLLLAPPYYGYSYGAGIEYGPPSPATQFMMSPQANAAIAYNYGYGVSPRRQSAQNTSPRRGKGKPPKNNNNNGGNAHEAPGHTEEQHGKRATKNQQAGEQVGE